MKKLCISLITLGSFYLLPTVTNTVSVSHAAGSTEPSQASQTEKQSVKVPAMRNRVYAQLARAQKLADEGVKLEGFDVLDDVKDRIDSLNSYEKAMLWNFYGFMYYGNDDIAAAIDSFEKVIAELAIPESLRLSTLYSLAQLSMQKENYEETLAYLSQWKAVNTKPLTSEQHILFAQVYYQDKQFKSSLAAVDKAIAEAKSKDKLPKENWLILQRANFYELKQPEKVTQVLEQLVNLYEKPEYWLQLSGMYGETGKEDKQLAAMETAWQAGYVVKEQDIVTLAQLYRFHGVPYKAAKLLDDAIAEGKIVANERHYEMLAQSYLAAKNDKKAISPLLKASEISDSGKFDAQLAQAYLSTEKWQLAITSADSALSRGGIKRVGDMHLIIGMSYFNLEQFEQSLTAFKSAEKIASSAKTASQWRKYVEREKVQHAQLAMLN
ncbi:tetratricopeptide repeat protein [Colwelliaceae bacterium 6441]